jgi:hypothetical protein
MHGLHGSYRRWVTCFTPKGRLHSRTDSSSAEIVGRVSCCAPKGQFHVRRAWRAAPGTALDNRGAKANREVTWR